MTIVVAKARVVKRLKQKTKTTGDLILTDQCQPQAFHQVNIPHSNDTVLMSKQARTQKGTRGELGRNERDGRKCHARATPRNSTNKQRVGRQEATLRFIPES